jgi:hypothetical protein
MYRQLIRRICFRVEIVEKADLKENGELSGVFLPKFLLSSVMSP